MNYANLKLIDQPAWKVVVVDAVARVLGILVKVDGIPIGSSRNYIRKKAREAMEDEAMVEKLGLREKRPGAFPPTTKG